MARDREAPAAALRAWLASRVAGVLGELRVSSDDLRRELSDGRAELERVEAQTARLSRLTEALADELAWMKLPFSGEMSIHQARVRHPGAPAVLSAHHLPACEGCAVRFDETVHEAAAAYALNLDALLADLNSLLASG